MTSFTACHVSGAVGELDITVTKLQVGYSNVCKTVDAIKIRSKKKLFAIGPVLFDPVTQTYAPEVKKYRISCVGQYYGFL
jgi:hypothetical protein